MQHGVPGKASKNLKSRALDAATRRPRRSGAQPEREGGAQSLHAASASIISASYAPSTPAPAPVASVRARMASPGGAAAAAAIAYRAAAATEAAAAAESSGSGSRSRRRRRAVHAVDRSTQTLSPGNPVCTSRARVNRAPGPKYLFGIAKNLSLSKHIASHRTPRERRKNICLSPHACAHATVDNSEIEGARWTMGISWYAPIRNMSGGRRFSHVMCLALNLQWVAGIKKTSH